VVLWQIFGTKMEGMRRGWEVVHHEELCDVRSLSDIIKVIQSMSTVQCRWDFVGKFEGNILLCRYMYKCENNIKMTLRAVGWKYMP
jgi:hypothetical protein